MYSLFLLDIMILQIFVFETLMSDKTPPDAHLHTVELTMSEIDCMKSGKQVTVLTSSNGGHNHELKLYYNTKWNISKYLTLNTLSDR